MKKRETLYSQLKPFSFQVFTKTPLPHPADLDFKLLKVRRHHPLYIAIYLYTIYYIKIFDFKTRARY